MERCRIHLRIPFYGIPPQSMRNYVFSWNVQREVCSADMRRIEATLRTEIGLELRFPIGISKPGNKSRANYRQLSAPTVAQASLRHAATDVIRRLERFDHKQRIIGRLLQRLALSTCGPPRLQLFEGLVGPSCRHHDTHLPTGCRIHRLLQ